MDKGEVCETDDPSASEWESAGVGTSATWGDGRRGDAELCWDKGEVWCVRLSMIEAVWGRVGVAWVLMPAANFGDGSIVEEALVDKGECAGMAFGALRPEEVGR